LRNADLPHQLFGETRGFTKEEAAMHAKLLNDLSEIEEKLVNSQGGLHMNEHLLHAAQQVISTWDRQQEQGVDIVEWLNQMANAINQLREVVE
jgi:hypothetical protein